MNPVVVVGAGITGLTAADRLASQGIPVVVLERDQTIGGLARSFHYDGWTFDIGPHRFHTHDPVIQQAILEVLGSGAIEIGRASSVFFEGRYFAWPLRPEALLKLPIRLAIGSFLDLLKRPFIPPRETIDSFEDYVLSRYGRTLYEAFFRQYTEKFAFVGCHALHASWATASVDRAIIDRRIQMNSLWDVLRMILIPRHPDTRFIYPQEGCGDYSRRLGDRIAAHGGTIVTGSPVIGIDADSSRIHAIRTSAGTIDVDRVIWTAPITHLCEYLDLPEPDLGFMNTVLFNVILDRAPVRSDQWIYFSSRDILFARVSNPAAFCPANTPDGKGSLCVEVMCHDSRWWDSPATLQETVTATLERIGLCERSWIEQIRIEKVPDTYPIYTLDYPSRRDTALHALARFTNLVPTGRCGCFFYNNMDDSIGMGIRAAAMTA